MQFESKPNQVMNWLDHVDIFMLVNCWPIFIHREMDSDQPVGAGGHGFDSGPVTSDTVWPTPRHPAMFLQNCVAQTLNRGDGAHHSMHALV